MATAARAVRKKGPLAWSMSRLNDYEKCPQILKFKVIDRLKEPSNKAMERGSGIHSMAEAFINAGVKSPKVPKDLRLVETELRALKKLGAVPEEQWTFTKDFKDTTSWFGEAAWCRVKIDAVTELKVSDAPQVRMLEASVFEGMDPSARGAWIVDWKTGQFRPEASVDQLELYTLSLFLLKPKAAFALSTLAYTDVGRLVHSFTANTPRAVAGLKKKWLKRVAPMQADVKLLATPSSRACHWCFFARKNGGPCQDSV